MTNKELIKLLSTFPEDLEVWKGYRYYNGHYVFDQDEIDEVFIGKINEKEILMIS